MYEQPKADGTIEGICFTYSKYNLSTAPQCWKPDGTTLAAHAGLAAKIKTVGYLGMSHENYPETVGSRVFWTDGVSAIGGEASKTEQNINCFDVNTVDGVCAGAGWGDVNGAGSRLTGMCEFADNPADTTTPPSFNLYTIRKDPYVPNCMWSSGHDRIFGVFTGDTGTTQGCFIDEPSKALPLRTCTTMLIPDMKIDLSGLPATATAGTPYTGTFTCQNVGADAALDPLNVCGLTGLPANLSVTGCTIDTSTPGAAWVAGNSVPTGKTITCTVGGTPSAAGTATINGNTKSVGDENPTNDTASLSLVVSAAGGSQPDMTTLLSGFPSTAAPNSAVNGIVTCTNGGSVAATGVFCGVTGANSVDNCQVNGTGSVVTLPLASLAAGDNVVCAVSATMPGSGNLVLDATTSADTESNTGNNMHSVTVTPSTPTPLPDMTTLLSGFPPTAAPNAPVTGNVTCTNSNVADATTVTCDVPTASVSNCKVNGAGSVVSLPLASLAAGNAIVCDVSATMPASGDLVLDAITSADTESNTGNNTHSVTVTSVAPPPVLSDMTTLLSGFPATAAPNASVMGSVACANSGPGAATTVTCDVPTASVSNCKVNGSGVTLPLGSLAAGDSIICSVTATMPASGNLSLTAQTSASNESNTGNNTSPATVTPLPPADMSISLAGLPKAQVNKPYSGAFTCHNESATTVAINAVCNVSGLPTGLVIGNCTLNGVNGTWTQPGDVPPGGTVTCPVTGTPTSAQSVQITGTTGADNDPASGDNNDTQQLPFVVAPQPLPNSIPTLTEWAMFLMSLMMIGAAGWDLRRSTRR